MLSICLIYTHYQFYIRWGFTIVGICAAYTPTNKPINYRDIFSFASVLVFICYWHLVVTCVHMLGICAAYSVHVVA